MKLVISNGHIVSPTEERISNLTIADGLVLGFGESETDDQDNVLDASGCWVTPGLIDLQVNGGPPCNFWDDPTASEIDALADMLVHAGVTAILPTLITNDLEHLRKNIDFLVREAGAGQRPAQQKDGSSLLKSTLRMPGIHLEGPCLSPQKPGVHPMQHLQPLDLNVLKQIVTDAVSLITLAPELDSSGDAVRWLREKNVCVALGHSNATYEEAHKSFNEGIQLVTHTFNAMPSIHHRSPGAVTAALLDNRVSCCVICDGHHLAPEAAHLIFKTKGFDKCILVTDVAHVGTSQGGLVGSSILLDQAIRNVVKWGIATFQDAITMATFNPARAMGWEKELGELAPGKQGDVVIWDKTNLAIKHVVIAGKLVC